jgi:hypothetical protein
MHGFVAYRSLKLAICCVSHEGIHKRSSMHTNSGQAGVPL